MAGEGNEGAGFDGAEFGGAGLRGPGFSSNDEFLGTLGEFGEPTDAPAHRRFGRRAAAAVGIAVALGAGGYGIAVAAGGSGATPNGIAALPAGQASGGTGTGPGCGAAFMRGAAGTLKSENGSTLTLSAPDNTTRTVNTNSSTLAVRIAKGSLADVANGDQVLVGGSSANNTLTAKNIVAGSGLDQGSVQALQGSASWLGRGFASGTVTDKTSSGFTVATTDGAHVTVAASSTTTVETAVKISVSALHVGQQVTVSGTSDANGTITASRVEEIDTATGTPGLGFGPGFGFGPGPGFGFGPGGPGARGFMQHGRPSTAPTTLPSTLPSGITPPNGPGGFGSRGHGRLPRTCGSATPNPTASSANPGA